MDSHASCWRDLFRKQCVPSSLCTMPVIDNNHTCEGEFHYDETVTYESLDGYRVDGTASGASSFGVVCGSDALTEELGFCSPVSCRAPTSIQNGLVDTREHVFLEEAVYVCSSGYTTASLVSGDTSFTTAKQCLAAIL